MFAEGGTQSQPFGVQTEKSSGSILYIEPIRFHVCDVITGTELTQGKEKRPLHLPARPAALPTFL